MSVSFVAAGPVTTVSTGACTATIPTCDVGDLMIAVNACLGDSDGDIPSGWDEIGHLFGSGTRVATRTAVDGDSSVTFSDNGSDQMAVVVVYRGVVGTPTAHATVSTSLPAAVPAGSCILTIARGGGGKNESWTPTTESGANLRAEATLYLGGAFLADGLAVADWLPGWAHTSGPDIIDLSDSESNSGGYLAWVTLPAPIAPNAPALTSPANNATIDRTVIQRLAWTFSCTDPADSQSAFDLRYSTDSGATWTTVSGTTPNQYVDIDADTFPAGAIEWQVRTTGSTGLVGPYSASGFFGTVAPPDAPTITSPTSGATIGLSSVDVAFSFPTITAFRWRVLGDDGSGGPDTGNVIVDTTTVTTTVGRGFTITGLANNQTIHIEVAVQKDGLWSTWADQANPVAYTAPETPVVTVAADDSTASITVFWTAPTPGDGIPSTASADVWVDDGTVSERKATLQAASGSWTYEVPTSGLAYSFQVVAVGTNGVTAASDWT